MKLDERSVMYIYNKIKRKAQHYLRKGQLNESLDYISKAANVMYLFNLLYTDDELEQLLQSISNKVIQQHSDFSLDQNRYLFCDAFGTSNRGLTQQYLRALISWNVEFLFILEHNNEVHSKQIIEEVRACPQATLFLVDHSLKKTDQIKSLSNLISDYRPGKALLHLSPWDVVATTVFYAFPQITRYQLNLTDHAFWLGTGCIDFTIEFRNYGCTISHEKRGIDLEHTLLQPYYPIMNKASFQGFPIELTSDQVIVFSGGSYYKIYGADGVYFTIVKRLLNENPSVVLLFAGSGDGRRLQSFIKTNQFEDRFFLIGERRDINEVFAHCDIYLGTYPFGGGLMSQYAAVNSKPILAYSTPTSENTIEELVFCNVNGASCKITHTNVDDLLVEATKLINDRQYRAAKGNLLKSGMITPAIFSKELNKLVSTNRNNRLIKLKKINYAETTKKYLEIQNKYVNDFGLLLFSRFRLHTFIYFPKVSLMYLPFLFKRFLKSIRNRISL